jgi:hypothetical protein
MSVRGRFRATGETAVGKVFILIAEEGRPGAPKLAAGPELQHCSGF